MRLISRNGFEAKSPKLTVNAYTMFHNHNGITFDGLAPTSQRVINDFVRRHRAA